MKTRAVYVAGMCAVAAGFAYGGPVGILIEKESSIYAAPVSGAKQVLGAGVTVLSMEGDEAAGKAHCQKLKAEGCKAVIAVGKDAALTASKELAGTPVVFCMVMNPEDLGLAGKAVTGVSLDVPMKEQLKAFKSIIPSLKKVGVVYSSTLSGSYVEEMKKAASSQGITLVEKTVAGDAEVPNAIRSLKGSIEGLYLPPDRIVAKHDAFQFIALFTFENNLPFMAPSDRFVKKGALIALMIDFEDVGKQAAGMAGKIAAGTPVSSLPVEPPNTTILVLNQKTAETIGINIPPSLLQESKIIK
jgi:putative ABC transport system substrate-binding protein